MTDPDRALARVGHSIEVQRARAEIPWVHERDLPVVRNKEPSTAWALSLFSGGGGQIYVGQYGRGAALMAMVVLAFVLIPQPYAWLPWLVTGLISGMFASRSARALNRYVGTRERLHNETAPIPGAYRLLAAQSAVHAAASRDLANFHAQPPQLMATQAAPQSPNVHQALLDQLRKLALLHAERLLNAPEYAERKHDALEQVPIATRADLDELLLALLPLRDEGVVAQEDFEFVKALGVRT